MLNKNFTCINFERCLFTIYTDDIHIKMQWDSAPIKMQPQKSPDKPCLNMELAEWQTYQLG